MNKSATESSIDVAFWFFARAEKDKKDLSLEKLQHLLFLSQVKFAAENGMKYLMPSLFICCEKGFLEPNVQKILQNGKPLMAEYIIAKDIALFLERLWDKYGKSSANELEDLIKSSGSYKETYHHGIKNIAQFKSMVENFNDSSKLQPNVYGASFEDRILFSQNGPVMVSRWTPRKIGDINKKGVL